jgi:hypothetical protein
VITLITSIEIAAACVLLIFSPKNEIQSLLPPRDELSLKTKLLKGKASLDDTGLHIDGQDGFTIPVGYLLEAEFVRLQGLGRIIRIEFKGGRLFISVVRLMIGQFVIINFTQTGILQKRLASLAKKLN